MKTEVFQGILIPFLGTTLGSACVLFMKNRLNQMVQRALTGFAAGAMVYVVVEELIPEMSEGKHSNVGTVLFAAGFTVMMALDVALG
jgi:ZIP family zinc transporter